MVVNTISATTMPSRPSTTLAFSMKQRKGAGLSSARRALSALGSNNAQTNLRMAESLLTITQDKFMKKWNFDPVRETPMAPGRFQWASVSIAAKATAPQEPSITTSRDISTCFTLPCQDIQTEYQNPIAPSAPSAPLLLRPTVALRATTQSLRTLKKFQLQQSKLPLQIT